MPILTSEDAPLLIDTLLVGPGAGLLGLTFCPGKRDGQRWARDLAADLAVIRAWGASTVVTLIEGHEFASLGVPDLGAAVQRLGMHWWRLPIRDVDIPDARWERAWQVAGPDLHGRLDRGERILIHCRGGLGRAGLVAGVILVERGGAPAAVIAAIRAARPGAIETRAQARYVERAGRRQG